MEKTCSIPLLTSFVRDLQQSCLDHIYFDHVVEISGYISVEIDNVKKERYVLSELLLSSGNVVSESFSVKAFTDFESDPTSCISLTRKSNPPRRRRSEERFRGSGFKYRKVEDHGHQSQRLQSQQDSRVPGSSDRSRYCQLESASWDLDTLQPRSEYCSGKTERLQPQSTTSHSDQYSQGKGQTFKSESSSELDSMDKFSEQNAYSTSEELDTMTSLPPDRPQHGQEKRQHPDMYPEDQRTDVASCSYSKHSMKVEANTYEDTIPEVQDHSSSYISSPRQKQIPIERHITLPPSQSESRLFPQDQISSMDFTSVASTIIKSETTHDIGNDADDSDCIVLDEDSPQSDAEEACPQGSAEEACPQGSAGPSQNNSSQQRKTQLSPGTITVIRNAVKQFKNFHFDKSGVDVDLLVTEPETLNDLIVEFFSEARKNKYHHGKDTSSNLAAQTLKNILAYLEMYLKNGGYPYSLKKDVQFKSARDFVKAKLNESGKVVSQKFEPVDNHDIEVMFEKRLLGSDSPETLSNTIWFLNSKYFAIRRPAEHFNLKWGDISLRMDKQGNEYLERQLNESFSLKVAANPDNPDRCFVTFYKEYQKRRPQVTLDPGHPFYVKICRNTRREQWYLPEPMMWFAVAGVWRKLAVAAGLPSNKKIF